MGKVCIKDGTEVGRVTGGNETKPLGVTASKVGAGVPIIVGATFVKVGMPVVVGTGAADVGTLTVVGVAGINSRVGCGVLPWSPNGGSVGGAVVVAGLGATKSRDGALVVVVPGTLVGVKVHSNGGMVKDACG